MAVRARVAEKRADAESATAKAVKEFLQKVLLQASPYGQADAKTRPNAETTVREALDRPRLS